MTAFLERAKNSIVVDIGQISHAEKRDLDRACRRGEITRWRGHWFPVPGAPFGVGPLKTCYGPP